MAKDKKDKKDKRETTENNMLDYMAWRGDIPISTDGLNEVDALIFSTIAYLNLPDETRDHVMSLKEIADALGQIPVEDRPEGPELIMDSAYELIRQMADSKRFGDVTATGFVNEIDEELEMQFSAATFMLPGDITYVAFRGTDNALIGWKEDLSLSFMDEIPAQTEAASYAKKAFEGRSGSFYICGHSKGGNLALWAAAHLDASEKEKLVAVYNNDGPGFSTDFLDRKEFLDIQDKVHSFIPESSIVGVLMDHDDYEIVSSSSKTVLQHNPFSWNVLGTEIVKSESRSRSGRTLDHTANAWIRSMSKEEREDFVDTLFEILMAGDDVQTLGDLDKNKLKSIGAMQRKLREMEPERRKQLKESLNKIFINDETKSNSKLWRALWGWKN